mgnify:CR=1 FL=1
MLFLSWTIVSVIHATWDGLFLSFIGGVFCFGYLTRLQGNSWPEVLDLLWYSTQVIATIAVKSGLLVESVRTGLKLLDIRRRWLHTPRVLPFPGGYFLLKWKRKKKKQDFVAWLGIVPEFYGFLSSVIVAKLLLMCFMTHLSWFAPLRTSGWIWLCNMLDPVLPELRKPPDPGLSQLWQCYGWIIFYRSLSQLPFRNGLAILVAFTQPLTNVWFSRVHLHREKKVWVKDVRRTLHAKQKQRRLILLRLASAAFFAACLPTYTMSKEVNIARACTAFAPDSWGG